MELVKRLIGAAIPVLALLGVGAAQARPVLGVSLEASESDGPQWYRCTGSCASNPTFQNCAPNNFWAYAEGYDSSNHVQCAVWDYYDDGTSVDTYMVDDCDNVTQHKSFLLYPDSTVLAVSGMAPWTDGTGAQLLGISARPRNSNGVFGSCRTMDIFSESVGWDESP